MNRFMLLFFTLLLALFQCGAVEARLLTRREPDQVAEEGEETIIVDRPMVGGYEHIATVDLNKNQMVQQAADFALNTMLEEQPFEFGASSNIAKVQVIDAWQQVVQGINFQLTLLFQGGGDDCVGACVVQIYNQFGALSVTNWNKELSCKEATIMMEESEGNED